MPIHCFSTNWNKQTWPWCW